MSISRKHFEAIAAALHSAYPHNAEQSVMKHRIAQTLAYRLTAFNPAFNARRFMDACLNDHDRTNLTAVNELERN